MRFVVAVFLAFLMCTSVLLNSNVMTGETNQEHSNLNQDVQNLQSSSTQDTSQYGINAVGSLQFASSITYSSGYNNDVCILGNSGKVHCDSNGNFNPESTVGDSNELTSFSGVMPLEGRVASIVSSTDSAHTCALFYDGNISCWMFMRNTFSTNMPEWFGKNQTNGIYSIPLPSKALTFAFSSGMICYVIQSGHAQCSKDLANHMTNISLDVKQIIVSTNQKMCVLTWENMYGCKTVPNLGLVEDNLDLTPSESAYLIVAGSSFVCKLESKKVSDCIRGGSGQEIIGMSNGGYLSSSQSNYNGCTVLFGGYINCEYGSAFSISNNGGPLATAIQGNSRGFCIITLEYSVKCYELSGNTYVENTPAYFENDAFISDGPYLSELDKDKDGIFDLYDTVFDKETKQTTISAGYAHTCAIDSTRSIQCWGDNSAGQLGIGSFSMVNSPSKLLSPDSYLAVSAGYAHSCAITTGNDLQCWGSNSNGQLGISGLSQSNSPTQVLLDGLRFQAIAVESGGNHTCALNMSSKMFCWGSNSNGQLGVGNNIDSQEPMLISNTSVELSPIDLTAGDSHTCAVDLDNLVYCWGDDEFGQLGHGGFGGFSDKNVPHSTQAYAYLVSAGEHHTCILSYSSSTELYMSPWNSEINGDMRCVGSNMFGQLGDGTTVDADHFSANNDLNYVAKFTTGWNHNCYVGQGYSLVRCWGDNQSGQIGGVSGVGTFYGDMNIGGSIYTSPVNIGVPYGVSGFTTGGKHTCVADYYGYISCVGANGMKQLGRTNSTLEDYEYPRVALSDEFYSAKLGDNLKQGVIGSSTYSTCYLNQSSGVNCIMGIEDFEIFNQGVATHAEIPFPEFGTDVTSVHTTKGMVCVLKTNKSVECVGNKRWNPSEFVSKPFNSSLPSDVTKLVLGSRVACGILSNSSIVCEGTYTGSNFIQSGYSLPAYPAYPDNISQHGDAVDIAISDSPFSGTHSTICALFANGNIACWGESMGYLTGRGGDIVYSPQGNSIPGLTAPLPSGFVPKSIHGTSRGFCVISVDDLVSCWGASLHSVDYSYTQVPTLFPHMPNFQGALLEFTTGRQTACALYSTGNLYCLNSSQVWTHISPNVQTHSLESEGICFNSNLSELHCLTGSDMFGWISHYQAQRGETTLDNNHLLYKPKNQDFDGDGYIKDEHPNDSTRAVECPEREFGRYSCEDVPPGYYVNPSSKIFPARCPPGTYQANFGSTDCVLTEPGNFTRGFGGEVMEMCGFGTYEPDYGSSNCELTSPGFFTNIYGSKIQFECELGTYQPSNYSSTCIESSPGHYVDTLGSIDQTECPAGTYLPGSFSTSVDDCIDTPSGFYSERGAVEPYICRGGTYQPNTNSDHCLSADVGYYVPSDGATSQQPCWLGSYSSYREARSCTTSSSGYFVNSTASSTQTQCSPGSFQPERNTTSCMPTEPGNYSGAGYSNQVPCERGTYQPYSNMSKCMLAGYGFYVPERGSVSNTQCPLGYSTVRNDSKWEDDCVEAKIGHFVPSQGGPETECDVGTYQPQTGQYECIPSAMGFYVPNIGMSSQLPCVSGTYQPELGSEECIESEVGYFVESAGATAQIPCPSGYSTNSSGATSILQCTVEISESEGQKLASSSVGKFVVIPMIVIASIGVILILIKRLNLSRREEMDEDEIEEMNEYEQMTQSIASNEEKQPEYNQGVGDDDNLDQESSDSEYIIDDNGVQWFEDENGQWWYWDLESESWFEYQS